MFKKKTLRDFLISRGLQPREPLLPGDEEPKWYVSAFRRFDYWLAAAVIGLSVFGLMLINSVGVQQARYGGLFAQQRFYVITGVVLLVAFALIDYRFILRFYIAIYGLCMLLLVVVFLIGADDFTNTARWLRVPIGTFTLSLQPSEFAKIFLIIALSGFIYKLDKEFNKPHWLLVYIALVTAPVTLIILQPSLSAGLVSVAIAVTVLFAGGLYYRTIFAGIALLTPAAALLYFDAMRETPAIITRILREDYQWLRIQLFLDPSLDPEKAMQLERSLRAIGTGGLFGKGYMNNEVVVFQGHNDFIFAVAAEQFGFVGGVALLGVIGFVIVRCMLIAYRATDMPGRLIAAGVAGMLLFETFVNVGVATSILPITGMPFPFLSYGGTSMWVHMALIGMVINVKMAKLKQSMFSSDES
jgi:rod shape determining protein RodA